MGREAEVALSAPEDAVLIVRGVGDMDAAARLIGPDGAEIAASDDAEGYGFRLRARVAAGEYRLMVGHCCGGGGALKVTVEEEKF
jgi:hypothetical protein